MLERLHIVLENLRVTEQERPNIRITLLFSIAAHAMTCGDKEMEDAARLEIARLQEVRRQEAERAAGSPTTPTPAAPAAAAPSPVPPQQAPQTSL